MIGSERAPAGGSRSCATEGGGSQLAATAARGMAGTDAINCVPPVCGADTRERVPPELPVRRRPSRNSVMTFHDNRAILLYVTIVTANRIPVLACVAVVECILAAWAAATDWLVGRYVIMPDHIHFFCAPASYPPSNFHRWMKRWKSLATLAIRRSGGSQFIATETADATSCVPPELAHATLGSPAGGSQLAATATRGAATTDARQRVPPRNPPLFQRDCWDSSCVPVRAIRRNGNMCVTIPFERDWLRTLMIGRTRAN